MAEAKISVRSDLLKIAEDLVTIANASQETGQALTEVSKAVGKNVNDQISLVSGGMNKMRALGRDLARQLGSDLKSLFGANAVLSGLKLNEQFSGSIKQAVQLNDTIRNLAPVFGMNQQKAEDFKRSLVKNLSEIGVGADAAANALTGLSTTGVRSPGALEEYAKTASQLAGITAQKGQEGSIAKGLAGVVRAQGGDVNDKTAMQRVSDDVIRIRNATGKSATEALGMLEKLFSVTNSDLKSRVKQGGGVALATAALFGGEGSTGFLERYLQTDRYARTAMESQGLGRLIGNNGALNPAAFEQTLSAAKGRGSGNVEAGLKTFGMSDEEAKGFLRLTEALRENASAIEAARRSTVNINEEYRKTMSFGDAFRANINRVKGNLSEAGSSLGDFFQRSAEGLGLGGAAASVRKYFGIEGATQGLVKSSENDALSGAVVGGSALLSAILLGGGLKTIGGALGGGIIGGALKKQAYEGVTGEKVQRVEVINWPGEFGALTTAAGGALGAIGKGALVGLAGAAGYGAGTLLEGAIDQTTQGTTKEGFEGNAIERLIFKLDSLFNTQNYQNFMRAQAMRQDVKVTVEAKGKDLKATKEGSRGVSQ